ncbi:hypothetical protein Salat_0667700 [Sesamum alatum]|uniref:Uncharacterized protein n=1 Tax=Sesamum alatum TaxID=300844 RepID=A0AAE1YQZ0_9LAMI|nr:hypothetical protein Salat_0667700 [Sesamum alatum]
MSSSQAPACSLEPKFISCNTPAFNAAFPLLSTYMRWESHFFLTASLALRLIDHTISLADNLSVMASLLVYLIILCLCLHACTARPLLVRDEGRFKQLQLPNRDVKTSAAEGLDRGANVVVQLDNQKSSAVKEAENIEGNKVKDSYSWKNLQQPTGKEIWKRTERSTLESPPSHAEETVSSKDNDTVEDIVVMDYAQPHRKPPIHNRGT